MDDLFNLKGKTALITGSSQGIGYALAMGLAKAGATIILNGRNTTKLEMAVKNLSDQGLNTYSLPFDVTQSLKVKEEINKYEKNVAPIDILVNNAGIQYRAPLEEFPAEKFTEILQTNVASAFYVGQTVSTYMISRRQGKIINIASVQSLLARPGIAPYTASKGALSNLTKGMATDWAQYNIQCNAIAPGYFNTPLNEPLVNSIEFSDWLKMRTPAGRWGEVHELVGCCIFLSSKASSFVNGQTIFVDGGITASL